MRRATYLNVILTINAVLLTALLWTALAGRPLLATEAAAQSFTRPQDQNPRTRTPTIPNAAVQRAEMIQALREIERTVERTNQLLSSGGIRVEAIGLDQNRNGN
ncbi:MAG: hypothetical protein ACYTJ0_05255 [Planctomycetota bacterium]|jgi:hypothetical protein